MLSRTPNSARPLPVPLRRGRIGRGICQDRLGPRLRRADDGIDPRLKRRVVNEGLKPYLEDNVQAWEMDGEGSYVRKHPTKNTREGGKTKPLRKVAQEALLKLLAGD